MASCESSYSGISSEHVIIVMDALKEFSLEPIQWALDHLTGPRDTVTVLGVLPWLNLPLSSKTRLDVWALDLDNLPALRQRSEWTSDTRYQKIRDIIELCDIHEVVPYMKVAIGYPQKLRVLEQITCLDATWVVLDRHQTKNKTFYTERIPCNVVMMKDRGEVDILKTSRDE